MKPAIIDESVLRSPETPSQSNADRAVIDSRFWLTILFWLARRAPWLLMILKRPVSIAAARFSSKIRHAASANARRIFGPEISPARCRTFTRRVVENFYEFVVDVARSRSMTLPRLRARIESIDGHDQYLATRRKGAGAIILTAHMGSFELGLAALTELETHIHVVFKRDAMDEFEIIRQSFRQTLGIHEAPIDQGWETWLRLRDALEANHVVVLQGDRAMPGQKSQSVPILHGHLSLPLGPIKLAQITGSPIIPVFAIKTSAGRCRIFVEPPIHVDPLAELIDNVHPQLLQWGKTIEKFVAAYPEQWLLLEPAFLEDAIQPS